ncbi:MAG TPA: DUF6265 family protein [Anaerolineae bacterium]|jgi:hypothetical protein
MTNIPDLINPNPVAATIDNLAWMAGSWYGTVDGDPVDEHWSTPAGGAMMGMFRWLKNGKVYLYELLAIEPDANGLVLRLKHFDRGLNGWEVKGRPVAYPLVNVGDQEAAFERGGVYRSTRFVYKLTGEHTLTVLSEERKGNEVVRNEFNYTRAQLI